MPDSRQLSDPQKGNDFIDFLPAALEVLEKPPAPFGRIIATTICLFFLGMVVWSYAGTVDIVVVAEGQIFPTGKVKVIQPLETGVVRAIHVEDGQRVKQNELLLELDPTETEADLESLKTELLQAGVNAALGKAMLDEASISALELPLNTPNELIKNSRSFLRNTIEKRDASLAAIKADINLQEATHRSADIEQRRLEALLPMSQDRLRELTDLFKKGLTEKTRVLDLRQDVIEMQAELETLTETRLQTRAAIASLEAKSAEILSSYRADAADRRQTALGKIASLEQSLRKAEQRQYFRHLTAPVEGYVDKLAVHTIGAVVETGTKLMTIVPTDTPLEIEAPILNKDMGFIEVGQSAEIKLEAFPFTRYGVLHGSVKSLSNDVVLDESLGPIYKARIHLDSQSIRVKGTDIALVPGMRATAEVKTGKRKIIDFFLSPILRYKDEAIRER